MLKRKIPTHWEKCEICTLMVLEVCLPFSCDIFATLLWCPCSADSLCSAFASCGFGGDGGAFAADGSPGSGSRGGRGAFMLVLVVVLDSLAVRLSCFLMPLCFFIW